MQSRVDKAMERLRFAAETSERVYGKPLTVCYSGGKDSQVLLRLAIDAGIDFKAQHSLTTVDAPETVRTVKETARYLEAHGMALEIDQPSLTMWQLIPKKRMPPTRLVRYCCKYLKENRTAKDDFIATGVRKAESRQRGGRGVVDMLADAKKDRRSFDDETILSNDNSEGRRELERCMSKNALCVNPIIDWTDAEVFNYYWKRCEVHNPLYAEGFHRVGCIGCPMAGRATRQREFAQWPHYERAYKTAFGKMLEARREAGLDTKWKDAEQVFHWWIEDGYDDRQLALTFDMGEA